MFLRFQLVLRQRLLLHLQFLLRHLRLPRLVLQLPLLLLLPRHLVRELALAQARAQAQAAQAAPAQDPAAPKTPYMRTTIRAQDSKRTLRTPEIRLAVRQAPISRLTSMGVPTHRTTRVVHWMRASPRPIIINRNTHINLSIYTISSIANKPPRINGSAFYTWETTPTLLTSILYRAILYRLKPIYPLLKGLATI